ncbi:MAG: sugar ABC transporter ATP-binding protein [Clostridiales bacterium]|nr:sugar ABC transporter ATP-binding protein [Clostridiales bacterium]
MAKLLEMRGVTKLFPGVRALSGVDYSIDEGEINALLGENGAGKSTLIKIVSGVYEATEGEILLRGKPVHIRVPADAQRLGIGTIHQEFNLFPNMTVLENIAFCANLIDFSARPLSWKRIREKAKGILDSMNINVPLDGKVKYLTVANQQLVEIAKALMLDVKLLIMDEPTAALTDYEIKNLFSVIRRLRERKVSIIYISHRMNEIMELADTVTVLRDGELVFSGRVESTDERSIAQMITGSATYLDIQQKFRRSALSDREVRLSVEGLTCEPRYRDVSFEVRKGEIFGFLGPLGAGKTEIGSTLFGILRPERGKIFLDGREIRIHSPNDALKKKIAYISEDRKRTGLLTNLSVKLNITLSTLMGTSKAGIVNRKEQAEIAQKYIDALHIKTPSHEQNVNFLSGGNQQKTLVARSLATDPDVLILDQPTRGLDIGAKDEIRKLLHALADRGMSVVVLTMEVPEAMELCDRIAVLKEGQIRWVIRPSESSAEELTDRMLSR